MTHTGFPSQCSPNSDRCLTRRIQVDLQTQQLRLIDGENRILRFPVSTAMNGPGEESGSGCTPRGLHVIRIKIGEGLPLYAVFKGRRPTGEIYNEALSAIYPERDWILTRILWLSGRQRGLIGEARRTLCAALSISMDARTANQWGYLGLTDAFVCETEILSNCSIRLNLAWRSIFSNRLSLCNQSTDIPVFTV